MTATERKKFCEKHNLFWEFSEVGAKLIKGVPGYPVGYEYTVGQAFEDKWAVYSEDRKLRVDGEAEDIIESLNNMFFEVYLFLRDKDDL